MTNFKKTQGFTLIELMIVVAIIAILAAIAIPAYQDYVIRSQVSEGINLVSAAKTAVAEYENNFGMFPADNTEAGLPAPTSIIGKYTTSVGVANGVITVTYGGSAPANTNIDFSTIEFSPIAQGGSIEWACTGGDVNVKYRPAACRP
jgi:type IV pilus assembly protein PilA